ncbi:hypothetical protein LQ948_00265 [Jiella sp. MQZ9-1]|uniref:Uncharacterized protein n=1 Tax=Jiella flava TaxID=2816857 RepID=A0A939FUF2_9HYPH|nr:hypothetical protein [Jiella flava]MBO0660991.1 hypothetical protein [Jiella flava]MCD2469639.1 hypothetical protein [Jiella flava]
MTRISARLTGDDRKPHKPRVLFVMQGPHHLMLYENVFRYCTQFDWYCVLSEIPRAVAKDAERFYDRYNVKFFADIDTALAHFTSFSAVVTTWTVPHVNHLPYLPFITLANEVGIPIFEMQHGLFQLGFSYDEHAAIIGSYRGAVSSVCAPDTSNFVDDMLTWFGPGSVGYPRAVDNRDIEPKPSAPVPFRVTMITNHHWSILSEAERKNCYSMILQAVKTFPEADFVLIPHHGEYKNMHFKEMIASIKSIKNNNFRIEESRHPEIYDDLISNSTIVAASVSTTLFDCELAEVPTVVFRNESQRKVLAQLQNVTTIDSPDHFCQIIHKVFYKGYRPFLRTGYIEPFQPEALESRLSEAIARQTPRPRADILAAVSRHLSSVKDQAPQLPADAKA